MAPLHMEQLARGSCPGDVLVTVYQAMHILPETSGDQAPYWLPPQEHARLIAHADMIMGRQLATSHGACLPHGGTTGRFSWLCTELLGLQTDSPETRARMTTYRTSKNKNKVIQTSQRSRPVRWTLTVRRARGCVWASGSSPKAIANH